MELGGRSLVGGGEGSKAGGEGSQARGDEPLTPPFNPKP